MEALQVKVCASRAPLSSPLETTWLRFLLLVDLHEQNQNLPGHDRLHFLQRRDEGCSRPVPDKHTHTHTQQNTSLNWERLLVIFTRGLVDRLPERVNRRFPGACNTSHGSSGTRRSATGEEQRERGGRKLSVEEVHLKSWFDNLFLSLQEV